MAFLPAKRESPCRGGRCWAKTNIRSLSVGDEQSRVVEHLAVTVDHAIIDRDPKAGAAQRLHGDGSARREDPGTSAPLDLLYLVIYLLIDRAIV